MLPAGDGAKGYISATFHAPGKNFKVHEDIKKFVYDQEQGLGDAGQGRRGALQPRLVNAMITAEAVREAVKKHGKKPTGEQVREGMENLDLTAGAPRELGFGKMMKPIKVTCSDHEGNGPVVFQQWDGKEWKHRLRLDRADARRGAADGGGLGKEVRRGEQDHAAAMPVVVIAS